MGQAKDKGKTLEERIAFAQVRDAQMREDQKVLDAEQKARDIQAFKDLQAEHTAVSEELMRRLSAMTDEEREEFEVLRERRMRGLHLNIPART